MRIASLILGLIASFALATGAGAAGAQPAPKAAAGGQASASDAASMPHVIRPDEGAAAASPPPATGEAMQPPAAAAPADAASAQPAEAPAPPAEAAKPAEAKPSAESAAPAAPPARHTVVIGPVGTDEQGRTGHIHTVARGDTLWDISEAYLGTPWVWPSIWQENPSVPNPHRIYPGNRIWISPTSMKRVSDAEADAMLSREPSPPPAAVAGDAMPHALASYTMSSIDAVGLVSPDLFEGAGSVLESPTTDAQWLTQGQRVYISLGEGQVHVGDRFTVVRPSQDVRDPETHHRIGVFVDRVGWIEVTSVHPESSEALIRESHSELHRGDRVIPHVEPSPAIEVRPSAPQVEGQVALTRDGRRETGRFEVVYLNRGTDHGLGVGTPLEVFRSFDDKRDPVTGQRRALPDDVIGSLLVLSAEPTTAVAVVTHSNGEIERGDHFRGATH